MPVGGILSAPGLIAGLRDNVLVATYTLLLSNLYTEHNDI